MPQFYFIPKRLARKAPWLASIAQWLEAMGFRFIFWLMRLLPLERAKQLAGFAFGLVGPYSDKANKAKLNLAIAFPDTSEAWREQTMRQIFRSLGYSAAELIKLQQIWEERDERIDFVVHPEADKLMRARRALMASSSGRAAATTSREPATTKAWPSPRVCTRAAASVFALSQAASTTRCGTSFAARISVMSSLSPLASTR